MAIIYLMHEIYDYLYPEHNNDAYELGKKFARITLIAFLFYYLVYFSFPIGSNQRHFLKRMILVDSASSVVYYGGLLQLFGFWGCCESTTHNVNVKEKVKENVNDNVKENVNKYVENE